MNLKQGFLLLTSIAATFTLNACGGSGAGGEITMEAVEKEYQLTFAPGAATPEEAFEKVVKALSANDFDAYVQVSSNEDMAVYGLIEALMTGYKMNMKNGREEWAANMKTRIDSLYTDEVKAEYQAMGKEAVEKNKEQFQRMSQVFNEYVDLDAIDFSQVGPSRSGSVENTDQVSLLKYYFTNAEKQKECSINLKFRQLKGKWYATGEHGASC